MGKLYIGSTKVNMAVKQPNSTNGAGKMFVNVNSLPDGYLRLEHIQSTGTQYIDTLDYIQGEDTVEIDFIPSIDSGNYALYGSDNGNAYNNGEYSCFYYNQNIELVTPTSNSVSVIDRRYNVYVANTSMNIKVDVSSWIVNGTIDSKTTFYNNYTTSKHLYIFATNRNNSAGYLSSVKLHYFKWNRNGNVLHNYIPALRTSDYKPGLYDTVNNVFYTNAGTGEFLYEFAEEPELPDGYTKLEYIQSTGTQYIDTQYLCSQTTVPNTRYVLEGYASNIVSSSNWFVNGISGNNNLVFYVGLNYYNSALYFVYGDGKADVRTSYTGSYNTRYKWDLDMYNSTYKVFDSNGTQLFNITPSRQTPTTSQYLTLCRWRYATGETGYLFSMRIYNVELYTSNVLQMKLIPALRNSDSKPGLYDLVNNTFYYNQGSGEFTYQELPASDISVKFFNIIKTQQYYDALYLEDTYGDSYINTGVKLNQDSYVSCEFKVTQYQTNFSMACSPFGARTGWQNNAFNFYIPINNSTTIYFSYGNQIYSTSSSNILNTTCVVVANKNNWSMVGATTASKTFTYTAFQNLGDCYMFNTNFYSENPPIGLLNSNAHLRISSLSIQDNGTLIRRFVPKVRNDGKPGMYDLCGSICPLTGTPFYINAGSHEFSYQV